VLLQKQKEPKRVDVPVSSAIGFEVFTEFLTAIG
jgi:hypothetical protein